MPTAAESPSAPPVTEPTYSTSDSLATTEMRASSTHSQPNPHHMVTRGKNNIRKRNPNYVNVVTATASPPLEPTSVKEALLHPEWNKAMAS
ncbi:unnamed protein product [Linum trigynum]|uniref:Uncharacterized protein n=1 Tax=Linum trigynum TaxID=586398 RepID=A0AAV2CG83_9ROSI